MARRWEQRLDNLVSMLVRLDRTIASSRRAPLSEVEQAGLIQQFEISWELGWKTMRDFLTEGGAPVRTPTPVNVIRGAFDLGLIDDGDGWIAAMKARNTMAHVYDPDAFDAIGHSIVARYAPLLHGLVARLEGERVPD